MAAAHPQIVLIGSVDVPTVAAFINEFKRLRFNPQMIIAAAGPDQGQAFLDAVGTGTADGIMVPNTWYGGFPNALSHVMVQEYIAKYGGTASEINGDVAEAYSAGQVMADAVGSVGLSQQKIIAFLHSRGTQVNTVQGLAQWGKYVKGRPRREPQGLRLRLPVAGARPLRAGAVPPGEALPEHPYHQAAVDDRLTPRWRSGYDLKQAQPRKETGLQVNGAAY